MWFGHLISKIRSWDYQAWEELASLALLGSALASLSKSLCLFIK